MKTHKLLFLAFLLSSDFAHAEAPAKVMPYELKHRSVVSLDKEARAPFWPIGWKRPKAASTQNRDVASTQPLDAPESPKFQLTSESFSVSTILLGNPSIAIINGRSFEEGQFLPVLAGDQPLKVQVRAIRDEGVWLQLDKQTPILVAMRRTALRPKTGGVQVGKQQEWAIQLTRQ